MPLSHVEIVEVSPRDGLQNEQRLVPTATKVELVRRSLDAGIRNPQVNDFAQLLQACPRLAAVAHNGGESFKHARAVLGSFGMPPPAADGSAPARTITSHRLPSTSPANASWSFERKLAAWSALMAAHGLL